MKQWLINYIAWWCIIVGPIIVALLIIQVVKQLKNRKQHGDAKK